MKRLFFLSIVLTGLLLADFSTLLAQSHRPIFVEGRQWDVRDKYDFLYADQLRRYVIMGDTLLDGEVFKMMGFYYMPGYDDLPPEYYFTPPILDVFVLEDTVNGRIYNRFPRDSTKRLVFDFNWQVGDTLPFDVYQRDTSYQWVESIMLEPSPLGGNRRVFRINSKEGYDRGDFKEEIGGQNFPFRAPFEIYGNWITICVQDSNTDLKVFNSDCADYYVPIDEQKDHFSIQIGPNPVSTQLEIKLPQIQAPVHAIIHDLAGKIQKDFIIVRQKTEIDLHEFPAGLYFISFQLSDQFVTKKLLIQKN